MDQKFIKVKVVIFALEKIFLLKMNIHFVDTVLQISPKNSFNMLIFVIK
jgi:hypothetical protein